MFRPSKKRPKKTRIVTSHESDEDDEEKQVSVVKRPKKKNKDMKRKAHAPIAMSFDLEEEVSKPSKRKKSRGMGYGGAPTKEEDDETPDGETQEQEPESDALYDKAALEKLKSQQRYKKKEPRQETPSVNNKEHSGTATNVEKTATSPPLASYIPLDSQQDQSETVILTGEEAMSYANEKKVLEPSSQLLRTEENTSTQAWEAEVVRRAGVKPSKATNTTALSLVQLQQQVQTTLSNLQNQQTDLQNAYNRRVADLTRTQEELQRQETELDNSGNALEYYQQLRQELASWVGALRALSQKVKPLQQAVVELDALGNQREWQDDDDDRIAVLQSAHVLENVLGRQVTHSQVQEEETLVDEFGRDIKSQRVLEREKRARKRQRIRQEWQQRQTNNDGVMEENSDACASEGELEERRERRRALGEALDVAMQDLDQEFTSLAGLFRVFEEWYRTYPEEYKQCFAALSLADLAGVLIRVELCSAFHPLYWRKDHSKTPQLYWLENLQQANHASSNDSEEETPLHQVLDKVLVPAVCDLLKKNAYNVFSTRQSQSLASFCSQLCAMSPNSRPVSQLRTRLLQYLRKFLDSVSIPIVKSEGLTALNDASSEELQEAMVYATKGQVHRLKKLLVNLLRYWAPVLGDMLIEPVLDFVSSRFLFVLSSLQAQGSGDLGTLVFSQVWQAAKETKWMERTDLMLQAAPIRAAAVAYGQS